MTDSTGTSSEKSHTAQRYEGTTYVIREGESVTDAVVRAVSAEIESHPTELEPLYSAIEPDALDTLFAPQVSGNRRVANGTIIFRYSDCEIRISDNREVLIKSREPE